MIIDDLYGLRSHLYASKSRLLPPKNLRPVLKILSFAANKKKLAHSGNSLRPVLKRRGQGAASTIYIELMTKFSVSSVKTEYPKQSKMNFYLRVYDNYHYGDESEAYNHGSYPSYETAVAAAEAIVDEFLYANHKPGMTADELVAQYVMFGEDPVILPDEHGDMESFSARKYARTEAERMCTPPEKSPMPLRKTRSKGPTLEISLDKSGRIKQKKKKR